MSLDIRDKCRSRLGVELAPIRSQKRRRPLEEQLPLAQELAAAVIQSCACVDRQRGFADGFDRVDRDRGLRGGDLDGLTSDSKRLVRRIVDRDEAIDIRKGVGVPIRIRKTDAHCRHCKRGRDPPRVTGASLSGPGKWNHEREQSAGGKPANVRAFVDELNSERDHQVQDEDGHEDSRRECLPVNARQFVAMAPAKHDQHAQQAKERTRRAGTCDVATDNDLVDQIAPEHTANP